MHEGWLKHYPASPYTRGCLPEARPVAEEGSSSSVPIKSHRLTVVVVVVLCAERHTSVSDSAFVLPALLLLWLLLFLPRMPLFDSVLFLLLSLLKLLSLFSLFSFIRTLTDTLKPRSRSLPGKLTPNLLRTSFAQSAHASASLVLFLFVAPSLLSNFRCTSFRSTVL